MKIFASEKLSAHRYKTPEGYLICTNDIIARTGKQEYLESEIGIDGDSIVLVDRPEDEVFSAATIASFENKPLTIEHPSNDVTIDNYKELSVGYVRDVHRDGQNLVANIVITDRDAIDAVESGRLVELSCGYDCEILNEDGYVQRKIRGNHVALVEEGRAHNAKIQDKEIDMTTFNDAEQWSFKLSKKKNDYDEYVIRAYKNGKYNEEATGYTDDWEDAVGTIKQLAKSHKLNFRQQGSVYVADSKTVDAYFNSRNLEAELNKAIKNYFRNDPEMLDYIEVKIDRNSVRVNAELSYSEMAALLDKLNPIIAKYNDEAYFEMESSGRAVALLHDSAIKDSSIEMQSHDFEDAFTYEDEDEPDLMWLQRTYNVRIHETFDGYKIEGNKASLQKLFNDHHLSDYGVKIKDNGNKKVADIHDGYAIVLASHDRVYGNQAKVIKHCKTKDEAYELKYEFESNSKTKYKVVDCSIKDSFESEAQAIAKQYKIDLTVGSTNPLVFNVPRSQMRYADNDKFSEKLRLLAKKHGFKADSRGLLFEIAFKC